MASSLWIARLLFTLSACSASASATTINVNWSQPITVSSTAATVEVDVMPFLGRTSEGGPFDAYFEAMRNLGSDYVRYAPWYPYPHVVVTEMDPPDCTATKAATNWNSTNFDQIVSDFMLAVCGPGAAMGSCEHSVAQQLSTMPSWLYKGGYPIPAGVIPDDPWQFKKFSAYNIGTELVDETCVDMAKYMARLVGHYTQGGHNDTCGHWHPSGFFYNWTVLSVLNENEHNTGGVRYTTCFDAIREEVEKINTQITLAGPEIVLGSQGAYTHYFVDPKNHKDGRAPAIVSNHAAASAGGGASGESYFTWVDSFMKDQVGPLVALRDSVAPKTELVLNEFIPFMNDWCDAEDAEAVFAEHGEKKEGSDDAEGSAGVRREEGGCPAWQDPRSNPVKINRKTLGWNAAAACFAYGYGRMALVGYKYVGADQLIGGPWPDNEPAVSCMDWKTGQVNAKYWAIHMLARALGSGPKTLFNVSNGAGLPPAPVAPGTTGSGTCGYTRDAGDCDKDASGAWDAAKYNITDVASCAAKAKGCTMGNFVSYSKQNNDCSWYVACDWAGKLDVGRGYTSEVLKANVPQPAQQPTAWAMPFQRHDDGRRGVLVISKSSEPTSVTLRGLFGANANGTTTSATVLDGSLDGVTVDGEPGFVAPVERIVGGDGKLNLGPYAVAVVLAGGTSAQ